MTIKHDSFFERPFNQKQLGTIERVYHYTSANNMLNIIKNSLFYVSRSDSLNDYSELLYFWEIFDRIISNLINDPGEEISMQERPVFLSVCEQFNEYICRHRESYETGFEFYILSFSENSDSLSLWSNYGRNDGYNLELALEENFSLWDKSWYTYNYGRVIYDKQEQELIIKNEIIETFKKFSLSDPAFGIEIMIEVCAGLTYRMRRWMLFFKNELFKQEEEIRVIFLRPFVAEDNKDFQVQFRVRESFFIPYIELNFEINSIKSVTIGPNSKMLKAEAGLSMFLKKFASSVGTIHKSKIPLRY